MKFHVTSNRNGDPVDFMIEVGDEVKRTDYRGGRQFGCECRTIFPVVSVGDDAYAQGVPVKNIARAHICLCNGELIP